MAVKRDSIYTCCYMLKNKIMEVNKKMEQSQATAKALRESDIINERRREGFSTDMVNEICWLVNSAGRSETAAEMEANMKLEEAIEEAQPANRLIDLASEYAAEAKEAGFKQGFGVAMRLCMEGMDGGVI